MNDLESDLSTAVALMLAARGDCFLTRVEAGGESLKRQTAKGTADWCGLVQGGRHLEIELKSKTGVRRKSQMARERVVRNFGGVYRICRSVGEVHAAIEEAKRC